MALTLITGHLAPSKAQLRLAKQHASSDFTSSWPQAFTDRLPTVVGWEHCLDTGILLKLKSVEPHTDDWCGMGRPPKKHRSIFWLLEGNGTVFFGSGHRHVELKPGGWVMFNHKVVHWVLTDKLWKGAAWQVKM